MAQLVSVSDMKVEVSVESASVGVGGSAVGCEVEGELLAIEGLEISSSDQGFLYDDAGLLEVGFRQIES